MKKLSPEIKAQFSLEKQWKLYLQRVGLNEAKMDRIQIQETKRAFMAGIGQIQILTRDELTQYDDDTAMGILTHIMDQVGNYFLKETNRNN